MKEDLWLPLRFSENKFDTIPIIVDSTNFIPFQFRTLNTSTGTISVSLVDENDTETVVAPAIHIYTIGSYTYYLFSDTLSIPAGVYYLKIVDGSYTYYSVPFQACTLEPIIETGHSKKWDMWLPLKFMEAPMNYIPIHVDSTHLIPFQFRTANTSTGTVTAYLVTKAGVETAITMDIKIYQIGNWTYYLFNGTVSTIAPGIYYLKLVDGVYTYYSVLFDVCAYETVVPVVKYGRLFNGFTIEDVRGLVRTGWHIITQTEFQQLRDMFTPNTAGGHLKETGLQYWNPPNTGATNDLDFNGRGNGYRDEEGVFNLIKESGILWSSTPFGENYYYTGTLSYNAHGLLTTIYSAKNCGHGIRVCRDTEVLSHGESGTYEQNDENILPTIAIEVSPGVVKEFLAMNLCETKFNDGSDIPEVTDDTAWMELTTGARCSYDNDETNAYT